MRLFIFISIGLLMMVLHSQAQVNDQSLNNPDNLSADEKSFYAETKQVNQFFRRFNAEEDFQGKRLSPDDPLYHDPEMRKKYIRGLFDEKDTRIPEKLKSAFINDVTWEQNPKYISFHGSDWFGEVLAKFFKGKTELEITLFMKLVKENLGTKWVIDDIYYPPYEGLYRPDEASSTRFLHPLSHELDFMNLDKVFKSGQQTGDYFYQGYKPDKLTIFLYELNNNILKFNYVSGLKFHFFQIDGWYFEITEFNRPGLNRGWLISNLIKLEDGQKDHVKNFIYRTE